MAVLRGIAVHTAATPHGAESTLKAIRAFHMLPVAQGGRGWRDCGYHEVITKDGAFHLGRPLDDDHDFEPWEFGAGVAGANDRLIHICCTGHGDLSDFTPAQHATLARRAAQRIIQFGLPTVDAIPVWGHAECDEILGMPRIWKTCPGTKVDMNRIRANVAWELGVLRGEVK